MNNYNCKLLKCEWIRDGNQWIFNITANRFLRGMVRLIVGASLRVATGKLSLQTLRESMERQERLEAAWSAPACGLGLSKIEYPYIENLK